jgi:MFS family permease
MRAPFALCIDALTYLASLVSLVLIRAVEQPRTAPGEKRQLRAELVAGLRFVFGDKYLRNLAIVGFACNFVVTGHSSMFILYAVQSGLAPGMVGLILSVSALGAVAGAGLARRLVKRFPCGILYSCAFGSVFVAPLVLVSAQGDQAVLIAMFVVTYLMTFTGLGLANVLVMSIRQGLTPAAFMGRMNAAMRTLLFGGGALGAVVVGELATVLGLRVGLGVLAFASVILVVPVALSPVGRLRHLPESPDDREPPRPGPRHLRSTGRAARGHLPQLVPIQASRGRHMIARDRQGRHRDRRLAERRVVAR